jgi:hypothetical protein
MIPRDPSVFTVIINWPYIRRRIREMAWSLVWGTLGIATFVGLSALSFWLLYLFPETWQQVTVVAGVALGYGLALGQVFRLVEWYKRKRRTEVKPG